MRSSNELDLDGLKRSSLSRQFLQNVRKKFTTGYTEVLWGKTSVDIPCKKLAPLSKEFCAAHSGPEGGIGHTNVSSSDLEKKATEDIDLINWKKWHHRAYGMAMSLYERTLDGEHLSGDPVADVFAVVARSNNCILILADGVNWGEKARLAAKSAVRGCMEYLNKNLFDSLTTHDVMEHLVRSFQYAQKCITDSEATMTTLCAGVVCELQGTNKWGLCTLNVGDSLAFVYSKRSGLREVTIGSHLDVRRDVTNPGGSLGRVDGYNPDLANLTCSFTTLEPGDIVFLTSDGITDNFDPVICKSYPKDITSFNQILEDKNSKKNTKEKKYSDSDSEIREFEQRHTGMINEMKEVLIPADNDIDLSAKDACAYLMTKVLKTTEHKRKQLEQGIQKMDGHLDLDRVFRQAKLLPGKLDHACVVAHEVGYLSPDYFRLVCDRNTLARQWSYDTEYPTSDNSSEESYSLNANELDFTKKYSEAVTLRCLTKV